jgi:two-component sensor histidine kinase
MNRPAVYTGLLLAWLLASAQSTGQVPVHLRINAERLAKAQALERQATAQHNPVGLAEAYYQYGRTYIFAGDYKTSQGYFLRALRLLEPPGPSADLSRIYVRLSENESRLGRQADALRYARLALSVAQRTHQPRALVLAYGVVGRVNEVIWEQHLPGLASHYDSVETYYQCKMPIFRALNDTLGMAETWLELGTLFTKVRDRRAIPYLTEALRLTRLIRRDRLVPNVMLHLATAYLTAGQSQRAFDLLRAARAMYSADQFDDYDTILGLENEFIRYYRATGQWKQAFIHQQAAHQLERTEMLSDREAAIARLHIEYETQKRETEIRAKNSQLTLQTRNWQTQRKLTGLTSALLVLAIGVGGGFFWLARKNKRISRRNEELVKEQNHRVKNNMQVVASLLLMQANRLTDQTAKQAVEESRLRVQAMAILHQRLYDGDQLARVDMPDFIRQLTIGVLGAYGFRQLQPTINVAPLTLSAERAMPVGLILNEVLTNACKHAFPHTDKPALQLDCRQHNHRVHIRIHDNGPGLGHSSGAADESVFAAFGAAEVLFRRSFGIQLIQSLTEQLDGTCQLLSEQGCVVVLEFPID